MGVYKYFFNKTKKEYLECPFNCCVKWHMQHNNCIPILLAQVLYGRWSGDVIGMLTDNDNRPWKEYGDDSGDYQPDHKLWKDITEEELISLYYHNPESLMTSGTDVTLHKEEIKKIVEDRYKK